MLVSSRSGEIAISYGLHAHAAALCGAPLPALWRMTWMIVRQCRCVSLAVWLATATLVAAHVGHGQEASNEVRQIVSFLFQPSKGDEARSIYERELKPIYIASPHLIRFRAFREAESPVPLDLVIVSSYRGMAGMDLSNESLRSPRTGARTAFQWYGVLSSLTQHHYDQFVEMLPSLGDAQLASADTSRRLTVFEFVRVAPGRQRDFERLLEQTVRPFERSNPRHVWSETGRMLVSDSWDYLRIFAVASLGDWHAHLTAQRLAPFATDLDRAVAARKTIILRADPALAVR